MFRNRGGPGFHGNSGIVSLAVKEQTGINPRGFTHSKAGKILVHLELNAVIPAELKN
jgi:hypothetical protein